jgi:signal peptidase
MEPALKTGDIVVVKKIIPESIKEGDVITFQVAEDVIITHRVKEIVAAAGGVVFKTKGDANKIEDGSLISEQQLLGRVIFRIPYGGYLVSFIRSKWGFVFLIVVPVIMLFYSEVKKIFHYNALQVGTF